MLSSFPVSLSYALLSQRAMSPTFKCIAYIAIILNREINGTQIFCANMGENKSILLDLARCT